MKPALARARSFCDRFHLEVPILMAPMSGACPPSLAIAVANAGGLGACGALLMPPSEIKSWVDEFRCGTSGPFQINLWIPDPPPHRDRAHEAQIREFLSQWGPPVAENAGDATPPDFTAQCEALLEVSPPILSSVMGLYPSDFIRRMKDRGIAYFANVSTVKEAKLAEAAGADVVVAQGMEAGGHRGSFDAEEAERTMVGLFSLLPAIVDAVKIPVVATGGIADERGVAAALALGASAAQVGSAFLVCPEARVNPAWVNGLLHAAPEDTVVTRVFSGRAGRSLRTEYTRTAMREDAPKPAPYPVQRGLTSTMRKAAGSKCDPSRMQMWAGQSAGLSRVEPAAALIARLWSGAQEILT